MLIYQYFTGRPDESYPLSICLPHIPLIAVIEQTCILPEITCNLPKVSIPLLQLGYDAFVPFSYSHSMELHQSGNSFGSLNDRDERENTFLLIWYGVLVANLCLFFFLHS